MKDWERELMEKVVKDMREGKQICLRKNYSEAMMWYSGERLLEVAPDIRVYTLTSGRTTLLNVNDILYMRTTEGFNPLGKASELFTQLRAQEWKGFYGEPEAATQLHKPQTDNEQRAVKAQEILDSLDWLKSEALRRLNEKIPGLKIGLVDAKVGYEQPDEDYPIEDGEIVLWINLDIGMDKISLKQLRDLIDISNDIVIININRAGTPVTYDIECHISYDFTSWDGKLQDSFVKKGEE